MLAFAVLLALSQSPDAAPENPVLGKAVSLFESREYARARRALELLQDAPELSRSDRELALQYLAATCHAVGELSCAEQALTKLSTLNVEARLSATRFSPELIALQDRISPKPKRPEPPLAVRQLPATSAPTAEVQSDPIDPQEDDGAVPARRILGVGLLGAAAVPLWYGGWNAVAHQRAQGFREVATNEDARAVYDGYMQRTSTASIVGFSVGAAFIAAGAVILATGGEEAPVDAEASVAIAPGFAGVHLRGSFGR